MSSATEELEPEDQVVGGFLESHLIARYRFLLRFLNKRFIFYRHRDLEV